MILPLQGHHSPICFQFTNNVLTGLYFNTTFCWDQMFPEHIVVSDDAFCIYKLPAESGVVVFDDNYFVIF